MGMDASGFIYLGQGYGDENPLTQDREEWGDDELGFGDRLMAEAGWEYPYSEEKFPQGYPSRSYDRDVDYTERNRLYEEAVKQWEEDNKDWSDYSDRYRAESQRLTEECPVVLETGGTDGYATYIIAVNGSYHSGQWDGDVLPDNFWEIDPQVIEDAKQWCAERDIEFDPKWNVGGYYW